MYFIKTLTEEWPTDILDGRTKSLDGNRYVQVFANKGYVSNSYSMNSKSKAGGDLKIFCRDFGIPEKLIFGGSKEQCMKNTEFQKKILKHNIDSHISEPNLHNQNPVEGVINEVRRKWYRTMIRK